MRIMHSCDYDFVVIGAGAVGLSVAAEVSALGSVLVLEARERIGMGTSSRNSEVVHAGIYYPPGSLKARLCLEGRRLIEEMAAQGQIEYRKVGKLIVAADERERQYLHQLFENAVACGTDGVSEISVDEAVQMEPHVMPCSAMRSASTGILDAHSLLKHQYTRAVTHDADFVFSTAVSDIRPQHSGYEIWVENPDGTETQVSSSIVVNCAGLNADLVAATAGIDLARTGLAQTWSKGFYYRAEGLPKETISHLVYPVPRNPVTTLGVHATVDLAGEIKFGPTAEFMDRRLENYALPERCPEGVVDAIARYLPLIRDYELVPIMAGIRAKIQRPGEQHKDFVIQECTDLGLPGFFNLGGIESPGLTASPAIGKYIAHQAKRLLEKRAVTRVALG